MAQGKSTGNPEDRPQGYPLAGPDLDAYTLRACAEELEVRSRIGGVDFERLVAQMAAKFRRIATSREKHAAELEAERGARRPACPECGEAVAVSKQRRGPFRVLAQRDRRPPIPGAWRCNNCGHAWRVEVPNA